MAHVVGAADAGRAADADGPRLDQVARLEAAARERLDPAAFAYYAAGSDEVISAGEAAAAWRGFRLLPRVLRDVSVVDTSLTLAGAPLASPVLAAPSALHGMAHEQGEVATARGVAEAGSLLVLSSRSSRPIEEVAQAAGPWWFQVYCLRDREVTRQQVLRATRAGAQALVLTVDAPYVAFKPRVRDPLPLAPDDREVREKVPGVRARSREQDPSIGPQMIGQLADQSGLPVFVKGVLRADDALRCVQAGAAGVIVSNHGGRQLDRAVASAHALRAVVEAVGGQVPVLVDGGIRTGTDVLVALALGARAVLVGRPVLWALAVGGAQGVRTLLESYRAQLSEVMALAGAANLAEVTPDLVAAGYPAG